MSQMSAVYSEVVVGRTVVAGRKQVQFLQATGQKTTIMEFESIKASE